MNNNDESTPWYVKAFCIIGLVIVVSLIFFAPELHQTKTVYTAIVNSGAETQTYVNVELPWEDKRAVLVEIKVSETKTLFVPFNEVTIIKEIVPK